MVLDANISRAIYNGLRGSVVGETLPPHGRVMKAVANAAAPPSVATTDTMSCVRVSLKESIRIDIAADPVRKQKQRHHYIKIGGDSACDMAEKDVSSRSILLLVYAWIGSSSASPNSVSEHRIISAAWREESMESVQEMARPFDKELRQLQRFGLRVKVGDAWVRHRFTFFLFGDLKWCRHCLGLGSAASKYCCIYCDITADNIQAQIEGEYEGSGYDVPLEDMMTLAEMRAWADEGAVVKERKREAKREAKEKETRAAAAKEEAQQQEQRTEAKVEAKEPKEETKKERKKRKREERVRAGQEARNQESAPALNIEPKDCPPEVLHMRLRIVELFEKHLAATIYPNLSIKAATNKLRESARYDELLRRMKVDRKITGLTGVECRKILNAPDEYLSMLPVGEEKESLIGALRCYADIDSLVGCVCTTAMQEELATKTAAFALIMVAWVPCARTSVYLHILSCHAHRWYNLDDYASYALEKINAQLKVAKKHTRRDKKTPEGASKEAKGSLAYLVRRLNARAQLSKKTMLVKKPMKGRCGACGVIGHRRDSWRCPVFHQKKALSTIAQHRAKKRARMEKAAAEEESKQ